MSLQLAHLVQIVGLDLVVHIHVAKEEAHQRPGRLLLAIAALHVNWARPNRLVRLSRTPQHLVHEVQIALSIGRWWVPNLGGQRGVTGTALATDEPQARQAEAHEENSS